MSVNLGQYADEFGALGYDDLPDLQTSSEVERAEIAKEVGMAPGHAKRFKNVRRRQARRTTIQ
eukprot:1420638-Prymnesium_polylepis.1